MVANVALSSVKASSTSGVPRVLMLTSTEHQVTQPRVRLFTITSEEGETPTCPCYICLPLFTFSFIICMICSHRITTNDTLLCSRSKEKKRRWVNRHTFLFQSTLPMWPRITCNPRSTLQRPLYFYAHIEPFLSLVWKQIRSTSETRLKCTKLHHGFVHDCYFACPSTPNSTEYSPPMHRSHHIPNIHTHAPISSYCHCHRDHRVPHYNTEYATVGQCQDACLNLVQGCDAVNYELWVRTR